MYIHVFYGVENHGKQPLFACCPRLETANSQKTLPSCRMQDENFETALNKYIIPFPEAFEVSTGKFKCEENLFEKNERQNVTN